MWQPLLLYALAAILLATTTAPFVLEPAPRAAAARKTWRLLALGVVGALALAALTFITLLGNLRAPAGPWLWLGGVALLVAVGLFVRRYETPTERWQSDLPQGRKARVALAAALLLILAGGIAARLVWLDRIPLGINPDEGDRTATAMQVLRGTTPQTLFEAGWYRISMMYFHLLAGWLKLAGVGYVQARTFTALWGMMTLATLIFMALRNWSWRAAIFVGATFAVSGVALQFSRETSEAGPTAALWTLSVALLLEGARRGRALAWIGAGLAGGFSLYFYPTGRTWPLLAALVGMAWLLRWAAVRDGQWRRLLGGLALAATASTVICTPFFAQAAHFPHEFALRFAETSVLRPENAQRLHYYDPAWQLPRLLAEQTARALGSFGRYGDGAGFWPTGLPLTGPLLAALLLLGLGYSLLRVRDPRAIAIAAWAVVGMAGMVLTVETPNLQRMATALPALFLSAAVLLDEVVQRCVRLAHTRTARRMVQSLAMATVSLLLTGALVIDARFYYVDYAQMNKWEGWNQEGNALTIQPSDTLHLSLGNSFHMVNSGWVRLLAPNAQRAGVRAPGSVLPLPEDGSRGLAFLVYPNQATYLPWLQSLYPAAVPVDYRRAGENHYFDFIYMAAEDVAATRGALVTMDSDPVRVERLGEPPPLINGPATPANGEATWSATLRVPQQWNYAFRIDGAPATLYLDGAPVLTRQPSEANVVTVLNLARGDHAIRLTGPKSGVDFAWAHMEPGSEPRFVPPALADLTLSDGVPHGFAASVEIEGLPLQTRQENALAACCMGALLDSRNQPLRATWAATLTASETGDYTFTLTLPGSGALHIGDTVVASIDGPEGGSATGLIALTSGDHPISVTLTSQSGANGAMELTWTPPGSPATILPGSALRPAAPLFGPPLSDDLLRTPGAWPGDTPLETVE